MKTFYDKNRYIIEGGLLVFVILALMMAAMFEREHIRGLGTTATYTCISIIILVIYSAVITIVDWVKNAPYQKAYENLWEKHSNLVKSHTKYEEAFDKEVELLYEGTEITPQEVAILSNFKTNVVKSSSIKSLIKFYRRVKQSDTVFLIRVGHETATCHFTISGASIDLKQALYVLDDAKKKVKDLSKESGIVEKSKTICN